MFLFRSSFSATVIIAAINFFGDSAAAHVFVTAEA